MTGKRSRHNVRTPNRTAIEPATNSGSASRSTRHTQNIVDRRTGSSRLIASDASSSGTPMM